MRLITFLILGVVVCLMPLSASAQEDLSGTTEQKLIVGTKNAPPFAFKDESGNWSGISIELWKQVADELKIEFEFEEKDLAGLLGGVEKGSLDAGVAAITVTAQREKILDFSHPFFHTGLGIVIPNQNKSLWSSIADGLFSRAFFKVVSALGVILLGFGFLIWFFERKKNHEQFGGNPVKGVGHGFWWAAVTMTTVGYGDKSPVTFAGRVVGVFWMFTAILIISGFTAAISSALTVSQLDTAIQGPEDLPKVRVATISNSTSSKYLEKNNIAMRSYASIAEGLQAVADGEIDCMVYDAPMLKYLTHTNFKGQLRVLPQLFELQDYALAVPQGSPLREEINYVLLKKLGGSWWQETRIRYLGE